MYIVGLLVFTVVYFGSLIAIYWSTMAYILANYFSLCCRADLLYLWANHYQTAHI